MVSCRTVCSRAVPSTWTTAGILSRHCGDFLGALGKHDRRERPERLAVFNPAVEMILHLRLAGISEDAAIAQRPRPELRAALKAADDMALAQQPRRIGADVGALRQ